MISELKCCPFCGSMPNCGVEFYESCGGVIHLAARVKCTGCGVSKSKIFKATDNVKFIPFSDYENAFNNVVDMWNSRIGEQDEIKKMKGEE